MIESNVLSEFATAHEPGFERKRSCSWSRRKKGDEAILILVPLCRSIILDVKETWTFSSIPGRH